MKNFTILLLTIIVLACTSESKKTESDPESDSTIVTQETAVIDSITEPIITKLAKADRLSNLPDFTKFTDTKEKKKAFFDFLRPMVQDENNRIIAERKKIKSLFDEYQNNNKISNVDSEWLVNKASQMRIKNFDITSEDDKKGLLRKVDIVPASLFLAQAANESAWGTSRFAREANNLFGQWCFDPGCGIIPSQRGPKETHEVRKFATVNDAVTSYVNNINSHNAYKKLRTVREEITNKGQIPTGEALAVGLEKYSERGLEYVKEIQAMIRVNKLEVAS